MLLEGLAPLANLRIRERADWPGRKRAPGAGRPPKPFWMRLLVALTHLRQGTSVRATGAIFGIHERSVRRYRDEIEELLVAHGFQPPGAQTPIRASADLAAYLDAVGTGEVLIDTTEVSRSRPGPWEEQQKAYSGKSKTHVVKATVVSDRSGLPLWVEANPSGEGKTFDLQMLLAQTSLFAVLATLTATGVTVVADKGFRGLPKYLPADRLFMPKRKPDKRDYPPEDQAHNHEVSRRRIYVEHAIGRMKRWKALHYWRRSPNRFDTTARAIGILTTII